jgi:type IV secretory pathway VirB6-like protein
MQHIRQWICYLCVSVLLMGSFASSAQAASAGYTCNSAATFKILDTVKSEACSYSGSSTVKLPVFSIIVCNYISILDCTLRQMYDAMKAGLEKVMIIVLIIFVAVYGAQLLIGSAPPSGDELVKRVIMMAAAWAIATQSTWAIDIVFNFFWQMAMSGIEWMLPLISYCSGGACVAPPDVPGTFYQLDYALYNTLKLFVDQNNGALLTFFFVMSYIFPPLFGMVISIVFTMISILVRSVVGFLMCVTALALLVALAPVFLSFMLFQSTAQLFQEWVKYMVSFTVQPILTFAFLMMWLGVTANFTAFLSEISNNLIEYKKVENLGASFNPENTIAMKSIKIQTTAIPMAPSINDVPKLVPAAPGAGGAPIPVSKITSDSDFLFYLTYHLTTLMVIAYAFSALMRSAPDIAKQLAGPVSVPSLGSGMQASLGGLASKAAGAMGGGGSEGRTLGEQMRLMKEAQSRMSTQSRNKTN